MPSYSSNPQGFVGSLRVSCIMVRWLDRAKASVNPVIKHVRRPRIS
jgi:hypothetical protein